MMGTPCFLIQPIDKRWQWLRRYTFSEKGACPGDHNRYGHDATVRIEDLADPVPPPGVYEGERSAGSFDGDSRWPIKCSQCDYHFTDRDERQLFDLRVYGDVAGREFVLPDYGVVDTPKAPAGAMYWAWWLHSNGGCMYWENCKDPRGHLMVVTPGGTWDVDSRARNCTRKDDRTHRCWIRCGEPPAVHVDKQGDTCAAGAGSIMCGSYHGFLRNGELT